MSKSYTITKSIAIKLNLSSTKPMQAVAVGRQCIHQPCIATPNYCNNLASLAYAK